MSATGAKPGVLNVILVALAIFPTNVASALEEVVTHSIVKAPASNAFVPQCAHRGAAVAAGSKLYFLPPSGSGSAALTEYDVESSAWRTVPIPPDTGLASHLDGTSLAAVEDGGTWHVVVAGGRASKRGGTRDVWLYDPAAGTWRAGPPLPMASWDLCSVGCDGAVYVATGAAVGLEGPAGGGAARRLLAPGNRQIVRVNATDGTALENSMKKMRAGGACACAAGRTFWAGGSATMGKKSITDTVEIWRDPLLRGGEPVWAMQSARAGLGGAACGSRVIFAGGETGGKPSAHVDVFDANATSPAGGHLALRLARPVVLPSVVCLGGDIALIAGGYADAARTKCSDAVYVLDTRAMPPAGGLVPTAAARLSAAGAAMGAAWGRTAVFYNGKVADVFTA